MRRNDFMSAREAPATSLNAEETLPRKSGSVGSSGSSFLKHPEIVVPFFSRPQIGSKQFRQLKLGKGQIGQRPDHIKSIQCKDA